MSTVATERPRVPWWLWPQVLCLDAPAVSLSWMAALAHGHHLRLQPSFYWGLGLATWMVYVLDRTADATSHRLKLPLSARHAFCLRHRRVLLRVLLPTAAVIILWLGLTDIPQSLLFDGLGLCVAGAIYLAAFSARNGRLRKILFAVGGVAGLCVVVLLRLPLMARGLLAGALIASVISAMRSAGDAKLRSFLPKEVIASLLIAVGCSVGVHFWTPREHGVFCPEVQLFLGLVLLNLKSIQWCEKIKGEHGEADVAQAPLVRPWGPILLIAALMVYGGGLWHESGSLAVGATAVIVSIAALLTGLLLLAVQRVSTEAFHLLSDLALILPLPLLWWIL